jgi:peroxiredoxin
MRVRRIASPVPTGNLVLQSIDGGQIRLSDFRGKAVLVEFFLAN